MQQRKKQPAMTRRAILEAAGHEFSESGYAGAGLGAIVERSGLTKGALFHHFADKRALATGWIGEDLTGGMRGSWIVPLEEVGSLDEFRSFCRSRCMDLAPGDAVSALVSLAAETAALDPVLGEALGRVFADWQEAFGVLLARGQAEGWIHRSIQPEVEAAILVSMFSGLSVMAKCNPDENLSRLRATGLEGYLETLRPQ